MERSKRNFPDFTVGLKFWLCRQQSSPGTPTSFSGTEFRNFKGCEGAGGCILEGTPVTPALAFQASASCPLPQQSLSTCPPIHPSEGQAPFALCPCTSQRPPTPAPRICALAAMDLQK